MYIYILCLKLPIISMQVEYHFENVNALKLNRVEILPSHANIPWGQIRLTFEFRHFENVSKEHVRVLMRN